MKKEFLKAVSAVLAVAMTACIIASCGKSNKEPAEALIASETYSEATVQAMEQTEEEALIQNALGDEKWDGDFKKLTKEQTSAIEQAFSAKGYTVQVTEDGIAYYDYVPTADKDEIAEIVEEVVGKDDWDGQYKSLSDKEKQAVEQELNKRGYDAEAGENGIQFYNNADRRAQTTSYYYDRLPDKNQLAVVVKEALGGDIEAFLNWDENLASLTAAQKESVLKQLNGYGYNLDINENGELYVKQNPSYKMKYKDAYDSSAIGGTTQPTTSVSTTVSEEPTENLTGTTAEETEPSIQLKRTKLSTFGGTTGGDAFYDVETVKGGGYVAIARFHSADGEFAGTNAKWEKTRSAIVCFDKEGTMQWKATFGGSSLNAFSGVTLEQLAVLNDGSIVAVGYTDARSLGVVKDDPSDALIVKVSADGTDQKVTRLEGSLSDQYFSVAAMPDGGYVVGGQTRSFDGEFEGLTKQTTKAVLVKYSADGQKQWIRSMTSGTNAARFNALAVTDDGCIYANCYAAEALGSKMQLDMANYAGYGGNDNIIFKFNADGILLTHQVIAGSGNDEVFALCASNGGLLAVGACQENKRNDTVFAGQHNYGETDAFAVRLSATMKVEWVKTYGGVGKDVFTGVVPIKGGYAVSGYSESDNNAFDFLGQGEEDAFVMTITENGTATEKYAIHGSQMDYGVAIASTGKKLAVVGRTNSNNVSFSGLTPAATGKIISFIGFYEVQ